MGEHTQHEWRIESDRFDSQIRLNGEEIHVIAADLSIRAGKLTYMVLELAPHHVQVVADPELSLIVAGRRFRVIEEGPGDLDDGLFRERRVNGEAHQSPLS